MSTRRRLDSLERSLKGVRPTPQVVEAATKRFEEKGELPDDGLLAAEVVENILRRRTPQFRKQIFREAAHELEVVREPARLVLRLLVSAGMDVNDPQCIPYDMPDPEFGTLGLHLLGWPECVAQPPYEAQAKRLFDQLKVIRGRVRTSSEEWFEKLGKALGEFLRQGLLPDEALLREVVLAEGEMFALMANYGGEGDAEVLDAFDAAAKADGEPRQVAIAKLQALASTGRLAGPR